MINYIPNSGSHYRYTVDRFTSSSSSSAERIEGLNFLQVVDMNIQSLEKLSDSVLNQLNSDNQHFTNKSKTLGVRFASKTCHKLLKDSYDLSSNDVTAKIVSLLTCETIDGANVKDYIRDK